MQGLRASQGRRLLNVRYEGNKKWYAMRFTMIRKMITTDACLEELKIVALGEAHTWEFVL